MGCDYNFVEKNIPTACTQSSFWGITEKIINSFSHRNLMFFSQIPRSLVSLVHISNVKLNGMSEIPGAVLDPKHKKDQCLLTRSSRRRVKAHKTWHTLYIYLAGLILFSVNFSIQYWVSDLCGKKKYILKCKVFFNQSKNSI